MQELLSDPKIEQGLARAALFYIGKGEIKKSIPFTDLADAIKKELNT